MKIMELSWLPVSRKTMESEIKKIQERHGRQMKRLEEELVEERKILRSEIKRLTKIRIRKDKDDGENYFLTIGFTPEIFSGLTPERTLEYLARELGYEVEARVGSAKFVEKGR